MPHTLGICQRELTEFLPELTEFVAKLSEFSQYRNSTVGDKLLRTIFGFCGSIFGNYYRKLSSIKSLG